MPPSSVQLRMKDEDLKLLTSFVDLLDKMLMLDPAKRIGVKEALLHPFLSGWRGIPYTRYLYRAASINAAI
jgi:serine/threonine-protein kinase PRP4